MNGDIINLGAGLGEAPIAAQPCRPAQTADLIRDAKSRMPVHDPFQPVLDGMASLVKALSESAEAPLLSPAEKDRLIEDIRREMRGALYQQATEVHRHIKQRTLAAAVGLGFVLAAAVGGCGYWLGWTQANAHPTELVGLGQMPVSTAALWAKFVRLNPGGFTCAPGTDKDTGRPVCVATLWSEMKPQPGTH